MTVQAPAPTEARIEEFRNCIGGEWVASRSGRTFDDVNPADTRDVVARFPEIGRAHV